MLILESESFIFTNLYYYYSRSVNHKIAKNAGLKKSCVIEDRGEKFVRNAMQFRIQLFAKGFRQVHG